MMPQNARWWGIHSGESGEAEALFMSGNMALDGVAVGDLSTLPNSSGAFKVRARRAYAEEAEKTIEQWAGQWRRFVHEVNLGEKVVYKSKVSNSVHLGQITGDYQFAPTPDCDFAHTRSVRWVSSRCSTELPSHLQKQVALPNGLWELTTYAAELLAFFESSSKGAT